MAFRTISSFDFVDVESAESSVLKKKSVGFHSRSVTSWPVITGVN